MSFCFLKTRRKKILNLKSEKRTLLSDKNMYLYSLKFHSKNELMAIIIKKVSSPKELKTFIRFNYELYKNNPYSVPESAKERSI